MHLEGDPSAGKKAEIDKMIQEKKDNWTGPQPEEPLLARAILQDPFFAK